MVRLDPAAERLFSLEKDLEKTKELEISSSPLRAAAFHIGSYCKTKNDRFMACSNLNRDPSLCHEEGKEVTNCVSELFEKIGSECSVEFTRYWRCLDVNDQTYFICREEELVYNSCMKLKLGIEKRLWKQQRDKDGLHDEGFYPEIERPRFISFAKNNKNKYEQ